MDSSVPYTPRNEVGSKKKKKTPQIAEIHRPVKVVQPHDMPLILYTTYI